MAGVQQILGLAFALGLFVAVCGGLYALAHVTALYFQMRAIRERIDWTQSDPRPAQMLNSPQHRPGE